MARRDHYHEPNAPKANSLRVAVSAFVLDKAGRRLLMIRRTDNDRYAIPGGGQEFGESVTQAVVREVQEETGLVVEVTGFIGIFSDPGYVIEYDDGEVRQEFSLCFRARPVSGELRTSSESKEVLWVEPAELDDLNIHPAIQLRIARGFEGLDQPFYT
ncbi:ADP-ribose pyrophosphatase YjhB, NUDIX family [Amycolatopsis lurida]|uniref:NUDIX hydrolase n=1 Tax=Amycolatopsis lurida NRRL 2430 TaxID=1460371 RepID=A0A2P2G1I0_AMYLU|nr:NUDIX domain-containing protein [Amycolatopsis lurida]KFU82839.1 NUDIX hydrolase [Amycolatopsis lurida NRRL 2430]SEE01124.1 ADP-ribose pyrophosphatase YjhB, NUDIX family [Amycolatopsis lurida]